MAIFEIDREIANYHSQTAVYAPLRLGHLGSVNFLGNSFYVIEKVDHLPSANVHLPRDVAVKPMTWEMKWRTRQDSNL